MLRKIIFSFFLFALTVNANISNSSIDEQYLICEESFDKCVQKCEEKTSKFADCIESCNEGLYNCNSNIEGYSEESSGEGSSEEINFEDANSEEINLEEEKFEYKKESSF